MSHVRLENPDLELVIDATHGADILSIKECKRNQEFLLQTPWADRAEAVIKQEQRGLFLDPIAHWMERYRGGWQMISPVAGPPRTIHGAPVGFHGEAAISTWQVKSIEKSKVGLKLDLFTLPVRIEREIAIVRNQIFITPRTQGIRI